MNREARRCSCCNSDGRPVMCVIDGRTIIIRARKHGKTHSLYLDLIDEYNRYIAQKRPEAPIEKLPEQPPEAPRSA